MDWMKKKTAIAKNIPLDTDDGAGVIVKPAFWVNACKSRTVAVVNESRPILKSTTSSTSIFSILYVWATLRELIIDTVSNVKIVMNQ